MLGLGIIIGTIFVLSLVLSTERVERWCVRTFVPFYYFIVDVYYNMLVNLLLWQHARRIKK